MKIVFKALAGLAAVALSATAGDTAASSAKSAGSKSSAPDPAATQSLAQAPIPQSVFRIPANASQGRNPFFPNSNMHSPDSFASTGTKVAPAPELPLMLNGLSGPPRRTAIVNGRTFEAGEQAEVRLPSGSRILIKCEEIKDSSAVFLIAGQRRELRLRDTAIN
jgi:hypothetical protein